MAEAVYRKLTGRRRGIAGYSQLWLAADHLLLVQSSRFVEQYRRFALADIQALVITGGPDRTAWQIAALSASIAWTLALFAVGPIAAKVFFGASGVAAVVLSIADMARGARCRCHLYTAVTRELLAPVSRVRGARAFLDRVRPAIESVQGTLSPDQAAAIAIPETSGPTETQPPELSRAPGYLPEILFGLFLVNAAFVLIMRRFPSQIDNVLPTTFFGEFVILIVALVRREGRDPRRFIYGLMMVALVFMGWDAVGLARSFTHYMGSVMEQSRHGKSQPPSVAAWIAFDSAPSLLAAGWRMVAGVAGLIAAWIERPARAS